MGCGSTKPKTYVAVTPPGSPTRSPDRGKSASSLSPPSEQELANERNEGYRATMEFLGKVPLFQRLPKHQHPILAGACESRKFAEGRTVVKEGELGSEFFVIREGSAAVLLDGRGEVATLGPGDYFGEGALLRHEPRTATVKAKTPLVTLRITRDKFQDLHLHEHLTFANRKAVGAGRAGAAGAACKARPPTPKSAAERQFIVEALRRNDNLSVIPSLDERRLGEIADLCWSETVPKGRQLITQGDVAADYFYVVKSGSFEVLLRQGGVDDGREPSGAEYLALTRKLSSAVGEIQAGGSFGELALLYSAPRAATIVALEDSVVWIIDRTNFKTILRKASNEKVDLFVKYLDSVSILKALTPQERRALAEAMLEVHFKEGEKVVTQGDPGSIFYVLCEGEVSVVKDNVEQVRLRASAAKGTAQYFGERALLNKEPRAATVVVTSKTALAMALDQESFNLLLGPLEDIFKRRAMTPAVCLQCSSCFAGFSRSGRSRGLRGGLQRTKDQALAMREGSARGADRPRIARQDLRKVGVLGAGAFGLVELLEHKGSGETYAMKGLSKGFVLKMGMKESVLNERFILMMTNSPFIIALYETYNGSQKVFFLLEPALGGELHSTYIRKDFYGSVPHAKYYSGCVVFAFEHLHERRIIYRDLKPENLLMNEKGQLKVTDMGLSKFVIGKTYTTCGTPDYFAPEIIASTGHTFAVDWWTLGILIFEMLTGHAPFEADSPMKTYAKVLSGIAKVSFPPLLAGPCGDLIKEMLQREPSQRLPCRPGAAKNLKDHAWFSGFDWEKLKALAMDPPYKPKVKSKTDIANFNFRPEDMPEEVPYQDDGTGWDLEFASVS